jgi:hypothetical protein
MNQNREALNFALVVLLDWVKREGGLAAQCNNNKGDQRSHGMLLRARNSERECGTEEAKTALAFVSSVPHSAFRVPRSKN